ncbi:MAG: pentapeptide repeat-containing protein [Pseudomonadota bacterium]
MPISTIAYIGFGVIFYLLALRFTWEFLSQKSPTSDEPPLKYFGLRDRLSFGIIAGIAAYFTVAAFMALSFIISASAIIYLIFNPVDPSPGTEFSPIFRATIALTAQTTVLGALIGLPITLRRTQLTREANRTADEGLLTDRINKAVASLGVTKETRSQLQDETKNDLYEMSDGSLTTEKAFKPAMIQKTEPNIEVRIGALLSLERIAQQRLDWHVHIMEIICAYIRENAPASEAKDLSEELIQHPDFIRDPTSHIWTNWLTSVPATRGDIATALQIVHRRNPEQRRIEAEYGGSNETYPYDNPAPNFTDTTDLAEYRLGAVKHRNFLDSYRGYRPDLRRTNFQKAELGSFNLHGVLLDNARLEGSILSEAQMQGASLQDANLQGADLRRATLNFSYFLDAKLQGAYLEDAELRCAHFENANMHNAYLVGARMQVCNLESAELQRADLLGAELEAADLEGAELSDYTNLSQAFLRGARLRFASDTTMAQLLNYFDEIFCGKDVMRDDPNRPAHWEQDDSEDFEAAYQAWFKTMAPIWAAEDRKAAAAAKAKRA